MSRQILFVSGVPRSGTTALVKLLNLHPAMMIGTERYFEPIQAGVLEPGMFERARFLDVRKEDCHGRGFQIPPADWGARYDAARVIGDKFPRLYAHLDTIEARFPRARHLYVFRNPLSVAESYESRRTDPGDHWVKGWREALGEWNASLARFAGLFPGAGGKVLLLPYEDTFGSVGAMRRVFAWLGLTPPPRARLAPLAEDYTRLSASIGPRHETMRRAISAGADWATYARLSRIAAGQTRAIDGG